MLDMIFVVEDSTRWHQQNMQRNPSHYSLLKLSGPNSVSKLQELSAGVYYNALIQVDGQVNITFLRRSFYYKYILIHLFVTDPIGMCIIMDFMVELHGG